MNFFAAKKDRRKSFQIKSLCDLSRKKAARADTALGQRERRSW